MATCVSNHSTIIHQSHSTVFIAILFIIICLLIYYNLYFSCPVICSPEVCLFLWWCSYMFSDQIILHVFFNARECPWLENKNYSILFYCIKNASWEGTVITKTRLFKYIENFTTKKWKFSDEKFWYFSYFCSKHRLWVLVRTASSRRF